MRGPRLRTLVSQITVLAAAPTTLLLLAIATLTLYLNQDARLKAYFHADPQIASALAVSADAAFDGLVGFLDPPVGQSPSPPAPFALAGFYPSGTVSFGAGLSEAEAAAVSQAATIAAGRGGAAFSDVVSDKGAAGNVAAIARLGADGGIAWGVVSLGPGDRGSAWREFVTVRLPDTDGLDVAMIDAHGTTAFHSSPDLTGSGIERVPSNGSRGTGAYLRHPEGRSRLITSYAPIGVTGWRVLTERPWNPWGEAFGGLGVVVFGPLFLAALVPIALIGLSANRATRPIRELNAVARRIASGDFSVKRVATGSQDEIRDLAVQFEAMATQLETFYSSLENQVAARTSELRAVIELSRQIGQTFDAEAVVAMTVEKVSAHPNVVRAGIWLSVEAQEALEAAVEGPRWMASIDFQQLRGARDDGSGQFRVLPSGAEGNAIVAPFSLRSGDGALATTAGPGSQPGDLGRFLEAVSAQVGVALDNCALYRRGRAAAAIEERNRLAREIHDTLAQSLTAVIVQLEAFARAGVLDATGMDRVRRTAELAREGLREARRGVQGLRASALDSQDLTEALSAAVRRIAGAGRLKARFSSAGDPASIPPAAAAELFRIAEEALTNVSRHSQAENVLVNLRVAEGVAKLVIEDDGKGIVAASQLGSGFGLMSMRERAERLGGALVLESEPGGGTRVEVELPLAAPPQGHEVVDS